MKQCRIHLHTHAHVSGSGLGDWTGTARQEPSRNRKWLFRRHECTRRHACIIISVSTRVFHEIAATLWTPRCQWILRLHSEEIVQLYFLKSPPSGCTSVTQTEGRGREKKTQERFERFEVRMEKNNNATVKYCGV